MWGGEYRSANSDISTSQLDLHKTGRGLTRKKWKRKLYSLHGCSRQSCPYSILGLSMSLDDAVTHDNGAVARIMTTVEENQTKLRWLSFTNHKVWVGCNCLNLSADSHEPTELEVRALLYHIVGEVHTCLWRAAMFACRDKAWSVRTDTRAHVHNPPYPRLPTHPQLMLTHPFIVWA